MRLIVCGGRDYKDRRTLFDVLDRLHAEVTIEFVIQGTARGADRLAQEWARERGVACSPNDGPGSYVPDWKSYGRAAGPIRNRRMIIEGEPDGVIAFPGETGTANMVKQAKAHGIKVWTQS